MHVKATTSPIEIPLTEAVIKLAERNGVLARKVEDLRTAIGYQEIVNAALVAEIARLKAQR